MPRYVYLIADNTQNIFKIGSAKNVEKRIKQLQTGNGTILEIVSKFPTQYSNAIEKMLHKRFKHLCITGEWFSLNENQVTNFYDICKELENICQIMQSNHFNKIKPDNIH